MSLFILQTIQKFEEIVGDALKWVIAMVLIMVKHAHLALNYHIKRCHASQK